MTTLELERVARDIAPQVGATGWRITERGKTEDGSTIYAIVPIIGGRLDGAVVFRGNQRDVRHMYDLLEGRTPTSRGARRSLPAAVTGGQETDRTLPEAPLDPGVAQSVERRGAGRETAGVAGSNPASGANGGASTVRLCAGCDEPLPEDSRSDQRTHDGACRIAAYRRENPRGRAASAAYTANRRAARLGLEGRITPEDVLDLWEADPVCVRCGVGRGVDHVSPLAAGGANARSNLQNLCVSCNSSKAAGERIPARPAENREALARRANHHGVTPSRPSTDPTSLAGPDHVPPAGAGVERGLAQREAPVAFSGASTA